MARIDVGETFTVTTYVVDRATGNRADAPDITLRYRIGTAGYDYIVTPTWISTGEYSADITPTESGNLYYRWDTDGAFDVADEGIISVRRSAFEAARGLEAVFFGAPNPSDGDTQVMIDDAIAAHVAQPNPHPQYMTFPDGDAAYAPVGHVTNFSNPHLVTKAQIGLGNVDNTADLDKPTPTATQNAINGRQPLSAKLTLLTSATNAFMDLADDADNAALRATLGLGSAALSSAGDFEPVGIVAGAVGAHASLTNNPHGVTKTQVGLGNTDNTSDVNKPVSIATQAALDAKQPIGSYAAAVHGHAIADTTGLQTALDGKVDDAAIFGTTVFGNPAPVSGTSFAASLFGYVEPRKVGGRIMGVRLHSGTSAGNIDIVRFTAGSPLNVAQRVTVAVVASAYQEILLPTPIVYQAGDYLGGDAPAANRLMTSAISEFNGGRFLGVTGAATLQNTTKTYTTGLNFSLILEENAISNTDDDVSLVSQSALSPFVIGTPYTPVVGTNGNPALTTFYAQPMLDNTLIESVSLYGGTATGIVQILKGVLNGATIDVTEQTYIRTAANVLQTIDLPRPFVLKKGEYFGFRTNTNVLRYSNGLAEWSGGKFSGAFADITVPTTTLIVTDRYEMRVNARQSGGVGLAYSMDVHARLFGAPSKPLQFVFDGNSHFAGTGGNVPPPTQIGTFLNTTVLNFGLSGQTTQMMTADAATQIDPLILDFINRGFQPVLLLKEIYNDVRINSLTDQQGVDNMLAYIAARKLANPSVAIGLVNLCATVTSGVFTSGRVNTINALLLAQALPAVGVDFLVDAYSNPELQNTSDLAYYQADGTHLTTAGAAIEARQIRRDMRKWLEAR